jgi:hypothetical protein
MPEKRRIQITISDYKRFEDELPMIKALEDALCDMYTEIIVFCA